MNLQKTTSGNLFSIRAPWERRGSHIILCLTHTPSSSALAMAPNEDSSGTVICMGTPQRLVSSDGRAS